LRYYKDTLDEDIWRYDESESTISRFDHKNNKWKKPFPIKQIEINSLEEIKKISYEEAFIEIL